MTDMIQVPVGFYVIKHPKGNVLFDTGNNDKIITDPSYWGAAFKALKPVNTPDVAIDTQLKKIGLTPDDINYVVVRATCTSTMAAMSGSSRSRPSSPEGRDRERVLAGARHRRPLHDRGHHAAALAQYRPAERREDDPARRRLDLFGDGTWS